MSVGRGSAPYPQSSRHGAGTDLVFPPSLWRGGHLSILHQGPCQPGAPHYVQRRARQRLSYLPKIEQAVSGTARVCVQTDWLFDVTSPGQL